MAIRKFLWVLLAITLVIVLLFALNISNNSPIVGRQIEKSNSDSADVLTENPEIVLPLVQQDQADRVQFEKKSGHNIQTSAKNFFGVVYPGMMQGSIGGFAYETYDGAVAGDALHVEDYFRKSPSSKLVPLISSDRVLAVSVFRLFNGKNYTPASLIDVSEKAWGLFPPISQMEAESILLEKWPNSYMPQVGLVHLDGVSPNYQFIVPSEEAVVYLVNAFTGDVDVAPKNFSLPEIAEESPPVFFDENGLLAVDTQKVGSWSPERLSKLEADLEKSNAAIEAGLLKLGPGPDFEIIFDTRQR
ncbi:MAG: hypothetical protein KZQ97_21610 [Candidatus Thiodiazotropha sp. (ex Dulcina madagascariensis)]|nr:hypothetical protein [Candidatus Thiodiazotropha sp. (ex Dulcina madagascariensis)]